MKPDWKDAPEWANYLAMDVDGQWHWYEAKPETHASDNGWWSVKGRMYFAGRGAAWMDTLEHRP